ncbi:YgiQ family radical SAM protein [Syntrophomonas palmitatica]|uniref:YgiQ family radical SAM protein n=1 Tax=Syntrophomonas palmitatica TaxID=402877 RepID=UPI0006D26D4E|nr:YgiQ family radical SAM protein [Syntrophomonas palmitatica]
MPDGWLVTSKADMEKRGWDDLDVILVSGDAYVDHPAFAAAILGRWLEHKGFRVGVIAQPGWQNTDDISRLGRPRLMFAVSAGNMDSMVNHYTSEKKKRRQDAYSPGGKTGLRPDRATLVYCNLIRQAFPGTPLVIGGVEASLRRLAHYDYWSDKVRRSILVDSRADLLVYGMGEANLAAIAHRIQAGQDISSIRDLRGTCYISREIPGDAAQLPAYEEAAADKQAFACATRVILEENNPYNARVLAQKHAQRWVVQNPPCLPLTSDELDAYYELPYMRRSHPDYDQAGGVPALETVKFSLVTHRGCFGGCSFCALSLHQGRFIQSRSIESLVKEAQSLTRHPDFRGTISDVGGPSANMYGFDTCSENCRGCKRNTCLHPRLCKQKGADHSPSLKLWEALRQVPGVKHLFVASGLRYDLLLKDSSGRYMEELCRCHVSGQLKVAPEHAAAEVTRLMRKSGKEDYLRFSQLYKDLNQRLGRKQYLVPYFMIGHPGCGLQESIEMAEFVRDHMEHYPRQVQNFMPTPMTLSTCMYYTGRDPFSGKEVYVPRSEQERSWQRALLQYNQPANWPAVRDALQAAGRSDLIGNKPGCLAPPVNKGRKK